MLVIILFHNITFLQNCCTLLPAPLYHMRQDFQSVWQVDQRPRTVVVLLHFAMKDRSLHEAPTNIKVPAYARATHDFMETTY